ncbi:hypothetical protein JW879_03540 [candidate division WOR-3 bacterium]|nr:hypothetical protein [candidate division WOR-3 bacterium]
MFREIITELKHHAPFTIFGAITGIVIMLLSLKLPYRVSYNVFYLLHPLHVFLSALVTAAMYKLHKDKFPLIALLIIGYLGSIGIATLSDSIIPYIGESILNMPNRGIHLGFIERWWLVNPLAIIGIIVAYYKPKTKFPHGLHVLLSTWASLFHIIMAGTGLLSWLSYIGIFIFLFLAVWIPCCVSDIIFPLLFIKKPRNEKQN